MSRYQKGKTYLVFTEARDSEWQWHQLSHMQVCTSLQADNHSSTSPLSFLQAGCPSCRPANSVKALKARALKARPITRAGKFDPTQPNPWMDPTDVHLCVEVICGAVRVCCRMLHWTTATPIIVMLRTSTAPSRPVALSASDVRIPTSHRA